MTKSDLSAHATRADIEAILAARKAAVTAQSIPVLPQSQPKPAAPVNKPAVATAPVAPAHPAPTAPVAPAAKPVAHPPSVAAPAATPAAPVTHPAVPAPHAQPAPAVQGQSIPAPNTRSVSVAPVVQAVDDATLSAFLVEHLPALRDAAVDVVTGKFDFKEVVTLGQVVSQAVHDGLPLAQGAEAAQLVNVIAGYLWDTYAVPMLPVMVKPFAGVLRSLLLAGIEAAYRFGVKKVGGSK